MILVKLAFAQEQARLNIKGFVRDQKSNIPLTAQLKVIYNDISLKSVEATSKEDGSFELKTLTKNFILQAKADGYIVSNVVMNIEYSISQTIIVEIPMVANSKLKNNQLNVEFATRIQENKIKELHSKQIFQAVDAINGSVLGARFRLLSTNQNEVISTRTSIEEPIFEHDFTKKEKILLEVTTDGYQKFSEYIDINSLDATVHTNTARLIKKISFFNLIIKNEPELHSVQVTEMGNLNPKSIKLVNNEGIYFGLLETDHKYVIKANTKGNEAIVKELIAAEGFNQNIIILEHKINASNVSEKVVHAEKQAYQPENRAVQLENQTLFFEQGSYALKPESKVLLENIGKQMLEFPEVNIEITGYTDNIGDIRQNQYLSEFRAKVISNFLFNKGIKSNRITLKANGSNSPFADNDSETNRQRNRRAELRFFAAKQ